jgi:hypothetical protein
MRIRLTIISVAVLALMASGIAVATGPNATGDGVALKEKAKGNNLKGDSEGKIADFDFDAQANEVYVEVKNDDGSLNQQFSGDVKCLNVVANTAYISGVADLTLGTNSNEGDKFLIKAVDRGSGNDRFDWLRRNVAYNCNKQDLKRDYPVIEGDVSVTG